LGKGNAARAKSQEKVALDSGAIIALSKGDVKAFGILRGLRREGALLFIPAPVLTEVLRGNARDASVHRILNSVDEEVDTSAAAAREAGRLIGNALPSAASAIDALIVSTALEGDATTIVTSDPDDIERLAPPSLSVVPV
jgi:predicted nucleic acid-binding protein